MASSPADDRFASAVAELVGHGAIQQRLNRAYTSALSELGPDDLPEELRPRFDELREKLGGNPITRAMLTDDEAGRITREIVAIAFELSRRSG